MVLKLTKKQYSELYGATKGDKIRLGDTDILIEIEKDLIITWRRMCFWRW